MKRFHLSSSPRLHPVTRGNANGAYKPPGFWYDVNLDWLRWLDGEGYLVDESGWMRPYLYEVTVDEKKILRISNVAEFDQFCDRFTISREPRWPRKEPDWGRLRLRYSGLEIAPYLWERRLGRLMTGGPDYSWYYGWDCASGIVWDVAAILRLKLVAKTIEAIIDLYKRGEKNEIAQKEKS